MSEVKLILKTNGYAPVSVNPEAFDISTEEVQISREENVWSVIKKPESLSINKPLLSDEDGESFDISKIRLFENEVSEFDPDCYDGLRNMQVPIFFSEPYSIITSNTLVYKSSIPRLIEHLH